MILDRLFNSKVGVIILSIIWGLGLSTLFVRAYRQEPCYVINGHPISKVVDSYYNYGTDKCYRYSPVITDCGGQLRPKTPLRGGRCDPNPL